MKDYRFKVLLYAAFFVSMLHSTTVLSQSEIGVTYYYDGYWGEWKKNFLSIKGDYSGFIVYDRNEHPSNYYFSFQITDKQKYTSKDIKKYYRKKQWFEYTGIVEYYICDVYPTAKDIFKKFGRLLRKEDIESYAYEEQLPLVKATKMAQTGDGKLIGLVRKKSNAKIKIQPYWPPKHPVTYNIYFDDIGIAFDLGYTRFDTKKKIYEY